jgi:hypothetical protein
MTYIFLKIGLLYDNMTQFCIGTLFAVDIA